MEGKIVILSVLILSLVTTQIQVEAGCCPMAIIPPTGINCYDLSPDVCAKTYGCRPSIGNICPHTGNSGKMNSQSLVLEQGKSQNWSCCGRTIVGQPNQCRNLSPVVCARTPDCVLYAGNICPLIGSSGAAIIEYCKLGCGSSVCNAISTLQVSGEEVVNEAVGQCKTACSAFCTKGSRPEIA